MLIKFQNQIIDSASFPIVIFQDGITWKTTSDYAVGFSFDNVMDSSKTEAEIQEERGEITARLLYTYWDALANNHTCFDVEFELNKILAIKNGSSLV